MLSENELELVKAFAKDTKRKDAVKKVLLQHLGDSNWIFGIDAKQELSNEQYGELVRATRNAILLMEKAFNEIELMAIEPQAETKRVKI